MKHIIKKEFLSVSAMSNSTLNDLIDITKVQNYPTHSLIFNYKISPSKVVFVKDGLVRVFNKDKHKTEHNSDLMYSSNFFIPDKMSENHFENSNLQSLTPTVTFEILLEDLEELSKKNEEVNKFFRTLYAKTYHKLQIKYLNNLTLNASERYLLLKKNIPNIDKQINQYHIASYLGITTIQLSRIRKKLKEAV